MMLFTSHHSRVCTFYFISTRVIFAHFLVQTNSYSPPPPLFLQGFHIKTTDLIKFLGLLFHSASNWTHHIKNLKTKCLRSINALKYLTHPSTGCNRKLLIHLYKNLFRSQLDYGSPIYNLANKSTLALLNTVQNTSLTPVLGAFRTSPGLSL